MRRSSAACALVAAATFTFSLSACHPGHGLARSAARSAARGAGWEAGRRAVDGVAANLDRPAVTSSVAGGAPGGAGTAQPILPNPALTPGAADPAVTQANIDRTICRAGYSRSVRPPESVTAPEKLASIRAYGLTLPASEVEFDHLLAIEDGGAPNSPLANDWPEPYEQPKGPAAPGTGSQTKDRVENYLHTQICSHQMSLADAQHGLASNWAQFISAASAATGANDG